MHTVREDSEPEAVKPNAGDYFIVSTEDSTWYVSTEMARHIEAMLDAEPRVASFVLQACVVSGCVV